MDDDNLFDEPSADSADWLSWLVLALLWAGIGIALHVVLSRA